ncbi:MAG: 3-oxoacid CoA-transferase [Deltaproteobacteria bacterium HGW-Deltaproteobacteria-12]|jgi:glutaconate CoA-transferase subunit B|nr:MAG: 3-oxoacid CoA-transferase [Deltaproteobacteria bacterium HGW-Deltaproteobacteria-12]
MQNYNIMELMICVAARELGNGRTAGIGAGAPCAAAMLSQKTLAPHLVIMFESGGVDPLLPEIPMSVGDSRTFYRAVMAGSMFEIMQTCSRGMVDYAILGGAQIDMYGNINSTMLGNDHSKPTVRLPGSGGSNDFASLCWRTIIMSVQERKRFVKKLDFVTAPGWLEGGDSREKSGLPSDSGPYRVITNMAVMDFEPETKLMRVISINPGYTFDEIQDNCEFELLKAPRIFTTKPPTATELRILRDQIDPSRHIIGR